MKQDQKHIQRKTKFPAQAVVEFALVIPLLLVIVISAVEFGRLFYTQIVIANAAREGAYYLSTHRKDYDFGTNSAPNTVIAAQAEAEDSGISEVTVDIAQKNCCNLGEYSVEVTVETKVSDLIIIGFVGNAFAIKESRFDEYPLSSSVEMMVQP